MESHIVPPLISGDETTSFNNILISNPKSSYLLMEKPADTWWICLEKNNSINFLRHCTHPYRCVGLGVARSHGDRSRGMSPGCCDRFGSRVALSPDPVVHTHRCLVRRGWEGEGVGGGNSSGVVSQSRVLSIRALKARGSSYLMSPKRSYLCTSTSMVNDC